MVVQGEHQGEHILILCNAIGSPVDSKVVELEPKFICLTGDRCLKGFLVTPCLPKHTLGPTHVGLLAC